MRRLGILFVLIAAVVTLLGCDLFGPTPASSTTSPTTATTTSTTTAESLTTTTTIANGTTTASATTTVAPTTTTVTASATTTAPVTTTTVATTTAPVTTTGVLTTTTAATTTLVTTADPGSIPGALIDETAHLFSMGQDWYDINLAEDGLLKVYTLSELDTYCILYDSSMAILLDDDDMGYENNFATESFLEAGTYHLVVMGYDEYEAGDYRLVVEFFPPDEIDILANAEVSHLAGAVERYDFTVTQAGYLKAYTQGMFDSFGYLYDSEGHQLSSSDDDGTNSNMRFDAYLLPGAYYITVEGYYDTDVGDYRMFAYFVPDVSEEHFFSQNATLLPGDVQEYEIVITQAGFLSAETLGGLDTYGILYDAEDNALAVDDDGGYDLNFWIEYFLLPGTYYLTVEGIDAAETGDYRITVDFTAQRFMNHAMTAEGHIDPGGEATYDVIVTDAAYLLAYTESGMDTYAYLYSSDMTLLLEGDDGHVNRDFLILYRVEPGTYHLKVTGYDATDEGDYHLVVDLVPVGETMPGPYFSQFGTMTAGIGATYSVTLTEPGYLMAFTISSIDTYGSMYDAGFALIAEDDDSGREYNFAIGDYFDAGTFTFTVEGYDEESNGFYLFVVNFLPNMVE